MAIYRHSHSFTSGELSPLMHARVDFDRYKNGCSRLYNSFALTQGPATRRPGLGFVYDLTSLGADVVNPIVRLVPFVFDAEQSYVIIFFMHTDGLARAVFAKDEGLVVYGAVPITECPPGTAVTNVAGDIVTITFPAGWDIGGLDYAQSADEMYFAQHSLAPHILKRYDDECWVLAVQSFTDQPLDWSDVYGWPERVSFHQQRVTYAANSLKPQTVWMTKAGDFTSFSIVLDANGIITDDSAIIFTLDSGTQDNVKWVLSGKALHIGTGGNEWTVTGNNRNALTPTNLLASRETSNGSETLKPLTVRDATIFVELHGRTVTEFAYDSTYGSYSSSDLSILAPHLTEQDSIVDWCFQKTPESIIWCVMSNGSMIGLTYQREHKVVGWHTHDTSGSIKAITAIPGINREDDVWFLVERTINGAAKIFVEKMADFASSNQLTTCKYLDSFLSYAGAPTDTLTGLDSLEGEEVAILADGSVHSSLVVSGGSITLDNLYSEVTVGLPYTSEVWPLQHEVVTKSGSSVGQTQRIISLYVDFYNTVNAQIGRYDTEDGETVELLQFRMPSDITGAAIPMFTGIMDYSFPEGFDNQTRYFFRQSEPLPMTILGITDIVEVIE